MSARDAVATAERYVQVILESEGYVRDNLPPRGPTETWAERLDRVAHDYGDPGMRAVLTAFQNGTIRRLWQQHRIVYDIDPTLWNELGDTDTDTIIPARLFTRLPHPNPFIAFPEPMVLPLGDQWQQRIHGMFVYGQAANPDGGFDLSSTADPNTIRLGLAFGGLKEDRAGKPIIARSGLRDTAWAWVSISALGDQRTVGQMIAETVAEIGNSPGGPGTDGWEESISRMIRRATSLLVYLCATNTDLTPLPKQTSTGQHRPNTKGRSGIAKPYKPVGVGYRIGAALAAHRRQERDQEQEAVRTGRKVAPHVRRAHFHSYKVGPGRQQTEVKWPPPIPVNVDGPAKRATIIPVKPSTS